MEKYYDRHPVNLSTATLLTSRFWAASEDLRQNILFIGADDICAELNCYRRKHIHSPNIDRLASEGVLFECAYRASAGLRLEKTSIISLNYDLEWVTKYIARFESWVCCPIP